MKIITGLTGGKSINWEHSIESLRDRDIPKQKWQTTRPIPRMLNQVFHTERDISEWKENMVFWFEYRYLSRASCTHRGS